MERQEVDSSNIDAVGYDETTQTLEIEFRNGVYQYEDVPEDVPEDVYEGLMGADSIGGFFHECIRDVYPCSRIE